MRQSVNRYVNRVWQTSREFTGFPHGQSNRSGARSSRKAVIFWSAVAKDQKDGWHAARPRSWSRSLSGDRERPNLDRAGGGFTDKGHLNSTCRREIGLTPELFRAALVG